MICYITVAVELKAEDCAAATAELSYMLSHGLKVIDTDIRSVSCTKTLTEDEEE